MKYNITIVMKDVDARIVEDIKIWKMFTRGKIFGGIQKDFIQVHT